MVLESFRSLLYEIRDLSKGGAMYAANISDDKIDGPFNLAMYSVIAKNAQIILRLFDIIEFLPETKVIEQKIKLHYRAVDDA